MAQTLGKSVDNRPCYRIRVTGSVQGVGFRPFIYQLATQCGISGKVNNSTTGAEIVAQGDKVDLEAFVRRISLQHPPAAKINRVQVSKDCEDKTWTGFYLDQSETQYRAIDVPADRALCPSCRDEILDPDSRRHKYAFNSCTDCGPRYSMLASMPFDRVNTSMQGFPLCPSCNQEYVTPTDRRFHGQGISCAQCGPSMGWKTAQDEHVVEQDALSLERAVGLLHNKQILAVKGIGGFHLCCDASSQYAVQRLRERKHRPAKPFALMVENIQQLQGYFSLTEVENQQLQSPQAPIVLLPKHAMHPTVINQLADNIAPGSAHIGVMLAYSPLHLLLLHNFGGPLIMTSGNCHGAPVCIDNHQAFTELAGIADGFLLHNRDIVHRCDDSLVKIIDEQPLLIRRARGYVPESFCLPDIQGASRTLLAMGADLKNCFALSKDRRVLLSAHNGDLSDPDAYTEMQSAIHTLCTEQLVEPEAIVVDKHPDYVSRRFGVTLAQQNALPVIEVQHHHAHLASCMLEHGLDGLAPVMAITLDGLGYGDDGQLWGGELLLGDFTQYQSLASLRPFPLLGGDKANREPWRVLLALLTQAGQMDLLQLNGVPELVRSHLCSENAGILSESEDIFPKSTSVGRLFDAVSALLLPFPHAMTYEGQAAMELEALALQDIAKSAACKEPTLPLVTFSLIEVNAAWQMDPSPLWQPLFTALSQGAKPAMLARWFHDCFVHSWATLLLEVKRRRQDLHLPTSDKVVLSGGVFQNQLVSEGLKRALEEAGMTVFSHSQIPCNDGGIAAGQIAVALSQLGHKE